ncbi:hypothetical protein J3R74_001422 [Puniceicoccus vermicola]
MGSILPTSDLHLLKKGLAMKEKLKPNQSAYDNVFRWRSYMHSLYVLRNK